MTPSHGATFVDLEQGTDFPSASVVKLEDGYVMIAVTEHGKQRRVTLSGEVAAAFARAIMEAVNG